MKRDSLLKIYENQVIFGKIQETDVEYSISNTFESEVEIDEENKIAIVKFTGFDQNGEVVLQSIGEATTKDIDTDDVQDLIGIAELRARANFYIGIAEDIINSNNESVKNQNAMSQMLKEMLD